MGSPNYVVEVVPLGWLHHQWLMVDDNCVFPVAEWDRLVPVPRHVRSPLHEWSVPVVLTTRAPWRFPPPSMFVATNASDLGWGFQSLDGHGLWPALAQRSPHFSQGAVHGVVLPPGGSVSGGAVRLSSNGQSGGCPVCQPSEFVMISSPVVGLGEDILLGGPSVGVVGVLSAGSPGCLGRCGPIGRVRQSTGHCIHQCSSPWCTRFGLPDIDLFADRLSARLPCFLARDIRTPDEVPYMFVEDWHQWGSKLIVPCTVHISHAEGGFEV